MRLPPLYGGLSRVTTAPGPAVVAHSVTLSFTNHWQVQTEWCWVAVAESIALHHGSLPGCQCSLASGPLSLNCCELANKTSGNQRGSLTQALAAVGHLALVLLRPPTFAEVSAELLANRPVAARFEWSNGDAHFVVIVGCEVDASGVEWLEIEDPGTATPGTRSPLCGRRSGAAP